MHQQSVKNGSYPVAVCRTTRTLPASTTQTRTVSHKLSTSRLPERQIRHLHAIPPFALHIQSVKFSGLFLPSITSIQHKDETHIDRCQPALMWPDRLLNNRVTLHVSARPVPFSEPADAALHLLDSALQREPSTTYCGDDGSLNVHTENWEGLNTHFFLYKPGFTVNGHRGRWKKATFFF